MPFGNAPLAIDFDATQSSDWDGGQLSYKWDFDDEQTSDLPVITHTFSKGSYLVNLIITDDEGHNTFQTVTVRATADTNPDKNDNPIWIKLPDVTVQPGNIVSIGGMNPFCV